jgi:hypothetical protein
MQKQAFGRRTAPPQTGPAAPRPATPANEDKPAERPVERPVERPPEKPPEKAVAASDAFQSPSDAVEDELEHWKALHKAKKRSFREPWRTCAIVTTGFFALSSWLLPDSVSDVAQLVTVALTVASIWAGWRRPAVG